MPMQKSTILTNYNGLFRRKFWSESINNGVNFLKEHSNPEDTIVIHDGIRPLVDELVLSDVIVKCQEYGNAVTSLPYNEQIFVKETEKQLDNILIVKHYVACQHHKPINLKN